jgi:hypothetical protein
MNPPKIWMHLLKICEISKTNLPMSPLKNLRQPNLPLLNRRGWKQHIFKNVCVCSVIERIAELSGRAV